MYNPSRYISERMYKQADESKDSEENLSEVSVEKTEMFWHVS